MHDFSLTTPVVFIIFNRPEKTRRVFDEIKRARPNKLLVISDGPRGHISGENKKVQETRDILSSVDWPCDVITEYSATNLGCRKRLATGLDWAFTQVDEAIVLEDDCLPHPSFFQFCQELLARYRYDQRIGLISGTNFQKSFRLNEDSYYFSNDTNIWGWATWRDRWQGSYDVELTKWPKFKTDYSLAQFWTDRDQQRTLCDAFEGVYRGQIDTWDYQWLFANRINGRLSIIPNVNLISNIGFDADATHTLTQSDYSALPTESMIFPLQHPDMIFANRFLDQRAYRLFASRRIRDRIMRRIRRNFVGLS